MSTTRRHFLKTSAVLAAADHRQCSCRFPCGPKRSHQVGFIGTGNQGMGLLNRFLAADLGQRTGRL